MPTTYVETPFEVASKKAHEVNDISLKYQLFHAAFACNMLLQDTLKEKCKDDLMDLNLKKSEAYEKGNLQAILDLDREKDKLSAELSKKRFQIFVEYLRSLELDEGRTIYFENQIVIYLPYKLLLKSIDDKGNYTKYVKDLRELMAHELGHAVLHTDDIINNGYAKGSEAVSNDSEKEAAANEFAKTLLQLRHDRNQRMKKNGTLDKYF